ncbi:MAG: hypothetical protein R2762_28845 [Bryobacteraceae bacterium]
MDPIRKAGIGPVAPGAGGPDPALGKRDNAKFEQVKNKAAEQPGETKAAPALPDPVTSVSPGEQKKLLSDLRQRVETSGARSPQELFRAEMDRTRVSLQKLRKQVDTIPKNPAAPGLRQRLESLEASFSGSEKMLAGMQNLDSPKELMRMQMQIYSMTQNLELVSKVVEQVGSGTKQLLQTQI